MTWALDARVNLAGGGVDPEVARRQQETAAELCRRLVIQPGVVLADDVGMGKTFVALAVAASVALAERGAPVVVMVPPGVAEKWVKEFAVFASRCLAEGAPKLRVTENPIRNGTDFLALLDDLPEHRKDLIVLTHGALSRRLADPWVELSVVRRALLNRHGAAKRRAIVARWARDLFNYSPFAPELAGDLLAAETDRWRAIADRHGWELADAPVPRAVVEALEHIDLGEVRGALANVPERQSAHIKERLRDARRSLRSAMRAAWPEILSRIDVSLPLLILDEAHHVKNDTQMARLFANPEAEDDAAALTGALGGMFERMLFLTATPFQLGHAELLRVLDRFNGVRWLPPLDRTKFNSNLQQLSQALDATQASAIRLERAWGRLDPTDALEITSTSSGLQSSDRLTSALAAADDLRDSMHAAEEVLRPWVIRHMRPGKNARRTYLPGTKILLDDAPPGGLRLAGDPSLPFLLATRAQVLVGLHGLRHDRKARAFFAEGLASSFEAYRFTRRNEGAGTDDRAEVCSASLPPEIAWYLEHIDRSIPTGAASGQSAGVGHPKIEAVVERAANLWAAGEKVALFCFYVETGKALRAHISRRLRTEIIRMAGAKLEIDAADEEAVFAELARIGDRIEQNPLRGRIEKLVRARLAIDALDVSEREQAVQVVRRFLRTPSFLARFVDLPKAGSRSVDLERPVLAALDRPDESGSSMADKVTRFGASLLKMVDEERVEVLDALLTVTTGDIRDRTDFDPGEGSLSGDAFMPNVRLANGSVPADRRRRLMLGFNSPFFPEVLVASAVMSEGVDLHVECRHVIHHDLDWSPSTLEQRNGRVDRIGSKAERVGMPIEIYEPYLAGMYDEKVYRVVKDRDRWFNVVMGEQIDTSEWATERTAERVPLPAALAASLTFDLSVSRPLP